MLETYIIGLNLFLLAGYCGLAYFVYVGLSKNIGGGDAKLPDPPVKISVVIALRNEARNLKALLESLKAQEYPDYEVILVDDSSTDDTRSLAESLCSVMGANFKVIPAGKNSKGWGPKKNAIHSGIEIARGQIIVTTDADCRPGVSWLKGLAAEFARGGGVVAGFSPLRFVNGLSSRLKALEALATGIIAAAFIGLGKPFIATGRNLAYRRDFYHQIGGFGDSGTAPAGDDDLFIQNASQHTRVVFSFDERTIVPSYPEKGGYIERKRRHFNVTQHYRSEFITLGALVYAFIACFSFTMLAGILSDSIVLFLTGIVILQIKTLVDINLLEIGSRRLKEPYRILDVLMAEIFQIPYTLILQPLSLAGNFRWKGRRL